MDDYQRRRRYRMRKRNRSAFDERLRRRSCRRPFQHAATEQPALEKIANAENLLAVNHNRKVHGGTASGPDGITDSQLGPREEAAIFRTVAKQIRKGTYEPSEARSVPVPKPSGGFRVLSIRSLVNRTVSAALATALTPFWENVFLPSSHGFRPNRGSWSMLLHMERIVTEQERYVIAQDDICKAFDYVPIDLVMELHRRCLTDDRLLGLIEKVLRGNPNENRTIGIDQGSAYSPLALNVLLHYVLDLPFSENAANPPQLRYADNLVYLGRSVSEGLTAIDQTKQLLLPTGMTLKGQDGTPVDLRLGDQVRILGYRLKWEKGRLRYGLDGEAWAGLKRDLAVAHKESNPFQTAMEVVRGWIGYYGPAFESKIEEVVISRILGITAKTGFREITSTQVRRYAQSAQDHWTAYRKRWLYQGQGGNGERGDGSSACHG